MSPRPLDSLRSRLPGWVGAARATARRNTYDFVLSAPGGNVAVHRDLNGYPSIRANDRFDAAWTKGWLHARDRLGQVRLTVMAAQGRMMELLGDMPLTRTIDRATRLLDMRGGLRNHVDALSPDSRRTLEAYCAGFEAGRKGRPFSKVLAAAGVDVGPHTPQDVLLTYRMICFFGLTSFQQIAEMIVAELVHDGADENFLRLLLGEGAEGIDVEAIRGMRIPDELAMLVTPLGGSNAFAVDGAHSATGGALVMSEAHMEVARFPPIFYVSHEKYSDGEYYQGVCVPGTPWVTMGRTRYVGWTYTFGHADNVDVLIERCENGRYLTSDGWTPFRQREEKVRIRGGAEETWRFWENDFGTVSADECDGDLPCVRWTGLHEATAGDVEATLSSHDCRTVDDLVATHRRLQTISLGAVLADRDGRVAYVHTGRVDERPDGWSGAYPRPGWDLAERATGPLPESARPLVLDPREGFVVSANEHVQGPRGERWVSFPEPEYRFERLSELLAGLEEHRLVDLVRASYDEHDRMAARLLPIWGPFLPPTDPAAIRLRRWDFDCASDPASMGLFHALHHEVVRALLETTISPGNAARTLDELGLLLCFQYHLDPALALERLDAIPGELLEQLVRVAWPRARAAVDEGRWSQPIRARFKSIFTQGKLPSSLRFSSDPVDFPGGPASPFQSRVVAFEDEKMVGGPAFHYCWDMSTQGGWYHIPGGASELPWGAGYGTGVEGWRNGRFHPLGEPAGSPPNLA